MKLKVKRQTGRTPEKGHLVLFAIFEPQPCGREAEELSCDPVST